MRQLIYARRYAEVLHLYHQLPDSSSKIATNLAIKACTNLTDFDSGIRIHQRLTPQLLQDPFIQTSLIHFYMQTHHVDQAEKIFSDVNEKTTYMYGAMLKGYVSNDLPDKVIKLFHEMPMKPDHVIITILFNACAANPDERAMKLGKQVLEQLPETFRANEKLITSGMDMLMKFGDVKDAERLFQSINKKTIITYGTMMKGYVLNRSPEKALEIFESIPFEPNEFIYAIVYDACASLLTERAAMFGKNLFEKMPKTFLNNKIVMNSAIHMFMSCKDVVDAEHLFASISKKSADSYGVMIKGYIVNHLPEKALDLYEKMPSTLVTNAILYTLLYSACAASLTERSIRLGKHLLDQMPSNYYDNSMLTNSAIHMLMKFSHVDHAEQLFTRIRNPHITTFSVMMHGYNNNQQPRQSLRLLEQILQSNLSLDESVSIALIKACSQIGLISNCNRILKHIPKSFQNNPLLASSLISMWGKAGALDEAQKVFQSISSKDAFIYAAMINAYGQNGMGLEAIDLYYHMPKDLRHEVSHTCVLNACSHSGLIDEAQSIFHGIKTKTERIICVMVDIIDCFSRLSMFDQALKLIEDYEKSNPPSSSMYMSVLSATRNFRRSDLSQQLFDRMKTLFPDLKAEMISASILVANTYSSIGDDQRADDVRINRIKQYGNKVKPGLSWTEVNDDIVEFKAHDRSHPRSDEIYAELNRLSKQLKERGHQYDSSWIIRPLKEGESVESVLCGHSEKLAIAYNLIQRPPPSFIQITKNLRICGDCHAATKLIAKIRQCEIIIRDANRTHHFYKNGQCSCQDHF